MQNSLLAMFSGELPYNLLHTSIIWVLFCFALILMLSGQPKMGPIILTVFKLVSCTFA